MCVGLWITCFLTYVGLKSTCVCDWPCSCLCVRPHCPGAVQRMSRGCGGCVGSVTQRGQWWDRTALQQQGMQQHHTQAPFEYCIRPLELSPWTPKALWSSNPALNSLFWGKTPQSFGLSWFHFGTDGDWPHSSCVYFYPCLPWLSESHSLLMCMCLLACVNVITC